MSNTNTIVKQVNSYWKTNPLETNNQIKKYSQICSNDIMLSKVENDIDTHQYKLYTKINDPSITPELICEFINTHYVESINEKFKFVYTPQIIKYFMENAITICFYSKSLDSNLDSKSNPMMGLIIGKKEQLCVGNNIINTAEVNFLSIHMKARNKNLTPLMISIYLRESILSNSISTAHFTIGYEIKTKSYGHKNFFHRPINVNILKQCNFIEKHVKNNVFETFSHNFANSVGIIYSGGKNKCVFPETIINLLYRNILEYNKCKYFIWEFKTFEDFEKLFELDFFHHFIIVDGVGENIKLINYLCMYRLDSCVNLNVDFITYSNGYIYGGFFENSIGDVIEYVGEYIKINKLFDVITWSDFFDINVSHQTKFLKGTGYLNYYMFNSSMPTLSPNLIGMVTI